MSYLVCVVAPKRGPVAGTYISKEVTGGALVMPPRSEADKDSGVAVTKVIKKCEKTHFIKKPVSAAAPEMMKHFLSS